MRKPIIAGNWKMYKTISQAIELANGLKRAFYDLDAEAIDIVLCPVFTALSEVNEVISGSPMQLGAQDVFWQQEGAFTGEVSPLMLKDVGCKYVIIGHSERRQYFGETNQTVNKKVKAALQNGLIPIMCVGETLKERQEEKTFEVLKDHIQNGLTGLTAQEVSDIVIAYEPVWAIGTGKNATSQQAQEAHQFIRKLLTEMFNKEIANNIRIQYGGSVKPDNIEEIMQQPDVDGALVGGASLKVDSFSDIVIRAMKVKVKK
ncbi:MAG: triose-phosphate isomerase [Candidatus Omnitrophica bacterium]|nr:triose-phosphate isomerase [Candidatus Omnitrophota bacterium]